MRRFLVFPPLFAVWFATVWFGLAVLNQFSFALTLRLISSRIRLRLHLPYLSFAYSIRMFALGACVGVVFALLDLRLSRNHTQVGDTVLCLLQNLIKSGVVAVALVLLYYGAFRIPLDLHLSRIPSPIYTSYRSISHYTAWMPHLLLIAALAWAMRRTLVHRSA